MAVRRLIWDDKKSQKRYFFLSAPNIPSKGTARRVRCFPLSLELSEAFPMFVFHKNRTIKVKFHSWLHIFTPLRLWGAYLCAFSVINSHPSSKFPPLAGS